MGLKNLDIKRSYISYGDDNIPKAFLVPALRYAKSYQRSVGFFSSSVFLPIMDGIVSLFRNGGKIQLIASPQLSEEDIQAINLGYEKRDKVITDAATRDFMSSFQEFDEVKLQLLVDLIASGTLDIKIATLTSVGIYHDKLGIIKDFEGNAIVFFGSANSSINAYQNNYEKIRVVKSWDETENDVIEEEENEFESLWQGKNPYVNVLSYSESAKENLITIIHNKKTEAEDAKDPIKLRDYQEEAIAAWVANDYHGFYVMATGTGKTWTAIFSAKKLLEQHPAMVVICAPYKHLVRQWADDVIKAFPDAKIVMVSSENAKWESQLSDLIIRKKYQKDLQIIVISTIASFKMQRFNKTLGYSREQKLLIVDEAHRFTERPDALHKQFQYELICKGVLVQPGCGGQIVRPAFPVAGQAVGRALGKGKIFFGFVWHCVPPSDFRVKKKASNHIGHSPWIPCKVILVFCGNLFSQFQQSVECLLFFGLFNQLRQKHPENIDAVMPGGCGNLVDEIMQLFDSGIGRLGFCKKIGQIADERVGRIIVDDLVGLVHNLLVIFRGHLTLFIPKVTGRCTTLQEGSKKQSVDGGAAFVVHWLSSLSVLNLKW